MIFCTIPDMLLKGTSNLMLVKGLQQIAPHAKIVATADDEKHERVLLDAGAAMVIKPYDLMAERMAPMAIAAAGVNADHSPLDVTQPAAVIRPAA
jgi:Trk K+ transport system NAD-binding subunit